MKTRTRQHVSCLFLLPVCAVLACMPAAAPVAVTYPGPDELASCTMSPSLCGLPLHDLGGGTHPNAWHIVFVGDGYLQDERRDFVWHANSLATQTLSPDGILSTNDLVAHGPELFHFWRIDVPSGSIEVDDDVLTNTPLGAHLTPPDNCEGQPFIAALEDRFVLAWDEAILSSADEDEQDSLWLWGSNDVGRGDLRNGEITRWPGGRPVSSSRVTFALVSHRSSGRANGTPGGNVRLSSVDGADVLAHELGHALFSLGDEYTEFSSCGDAPAHGVFHGPSEDVTEVGLLETANTSTLFSPEKWEDDIFSVVPGGNRWPCHAHPTNNCLMLEASGLLCPVCSSAVAERLSMRRCEPDTRPPRVAIEDSFTVFSGGKKALVAASAFDERRVSPQRGPLSISWVIEEPDSMSPRPTMPFAAGSFAIVDLTLSRGRLLRAIASDGTFTGRSAAIALPTLLGEDDDGDEPLTLAPLMVSGAAVVQEEPETGVVKQQVVGIGRRVTVALRPNSCTRVVRAGVEIQAEDGSWTTSLAQELDADRRINCGIGTRSSVTISFDRPADSGIFKIRGFLVDARGRSASTSVWTPHAVDDEACPLTLDATDDTTRSLHGPFDGLTITAHTAYPIGLFVRAGHGEAAPFPLEGTRRVSFLPVSFPTRKGRSVDAMLLAWCPRSSPSGLQFDLVTSSVPIPFEWDTEAPAIAATTSLPPDTETWEIAVVDESPITKVTFVVRNDVLAGEVTTELTGPPWRVSPPPEGLVTIRAVDAAGNVGERDVRVTAQRTLDSQVECP
jgi:hypothetical protein